MDIRFRIEHLQKEIIDHPLKTFIVFLIVFLLTTTIIVLVATFLSFLVLSPFVYDSSNNSTSLDMISIVNQNSLNLIGLFTNTMLTLALLIFSAFGVFFTARTFNQSQKEYEQLQREQKIRDIEKRLELFYIPAQNTLKTRDEFLKNPNGFTKYTEEVRFYRRGNYNQDTTSEESANRYVTEKLKEIEKYRFLAKEKTCQSFVKYIYEEESNENLLKMSTYIQKDVNDYLIKLYELKYGE